MLRGPAPLDAKARWEEQVKELKILAERDSCLSVSTPLHRDLVSVTFLIPHPLDARRARTFFIAWERGPFWPRVSPYLAGHNLPSLEEDIHSLLWEECGTLAAMTESQLLRLSAYAHDVADLARNSLVLAEQSKEDWVSVRPSSPTTTTTAAGGAGDGAAGKIAHDDDEEMRRAIEMSLREAERSEKKEEEEAEEKA